MGPVSMGPQPPRLKTRRASSGMPLGGIRLGQHTCSLRVLARQALCFCGTEHKVHFHNGDCLLTISYYATQHTPASADASTITSNGDTPFCHTTAHSYASANDYTVYTNDFYPISATFCYRQR